MKNLIIGVDLGGTNIKASAFDSRSLECLWEYRMATQVDGVCKSRRI